jgi:hypothetical protein
MSLQTKSLSVHIFVHWYLSYNFNRVTDPGSGTLLPKVGSYNPDLEIGQSWRSLTAGA